VRQARKTFVQDCKHEARQFGCSVYAEQVER
jgi:hypothetical protein